MMQGLRCLVLITAILLSYPQQVKADKVITPGNNIETTYQVIFSQAAFEIIGGNSTVNLDPNYLIEGQQVDIVIPFKNNGKSVLDVNSSFTRLPQWLAIQGTTPSKTVQPNEIAYFHFPLIVGDIPHNEALTSFQIKFNANKAEKSSNYQFSEQLSSDISSSGKAALVSENTQGKTVEHYMVIPGANISFSKEVRNIGTEPITVRVNYSIPWDNTSSQKTSCFLNPGEQCYLQYSVSFTESNIPLNASSTTWTQTVSIASLSES